ncbi:MAG: quinoprotein amine dehydrogenase [Pseudomonadota bacterium]
MPTVDPAVTFTPQTLRASVQAGNSMAMQVVASIAHPADFAGATMVYVYIVDDTGVILPTTQIVQAGTNTYQATLYTAPTLKQAVYSGHFTLKLCRDSACATQFPGAPVPLPYEITVTAAPPLPINLSSNIPLSASVRLGASVATTAQVAVKTAGRAWSATSDAAWLTLTGASGTDSASFQVGFDVTGLPVGQYNGTLTVTAADGAKATISASVSVLEVAFQIDGSNLSFNAVNGAPIPSQALKFTLTNEVPSQWSASSDSAWLTADPSAGLTPATTTLRVNPASAALPSGTYGAQLTFSSPVSKPRQFGVTLKLSTPTLSLSANSLSLGGVSGRQFADAAVSMNLNTETNRWPWTLSGTPAWLKPAALAGNVDQAGVSLALSPLADVAPLGTSTAVLNVGVKVNGDTLTKALTVTINKDQRKLLLAETGVALSSTPAWSRLTRTIKVSDNFGIDAKWSASSSQPWLTVTTSTNPADGTGALNLTANPAGLPLDQVSYATITLASSVAGVQVPETVKVAFWKGSVTPTDKVTLQKTYKNVIGDPIRPFAYLHSAGADIDVYNLYTGVKVSTVAGLGAALGDMAISPNGETLYVFDTANRNIVLVDLASMTKSATWPLSNAVSAQSRLLAMHPNGVNLVITNEGTAHLAPAGTVLDATGLGGELTASTDGRRVFAQAVGYAPSGVTGYTVDYSAIGGGKLAVSRYASGGASGFAAAIATNVDGSRMYIANGSPYRCIAFSGADLSEIGSLPGGDAYPNNVRVGTDGRVFCGISGWYSSADIWVHRPDGSLQSSFKIAGYARALLPRQMALSGDAMMLIALTDDPRAVIIAIGP